MCRTRSWYIFYFDSIGWSGDANNCVNIDECADGIHEC